MTEPILLKVDGEVEHPLKLTFDNMSLIDEVFQERDISRIDSKRAGDAITLSGLLKLAAAKPSAKYLGLHSSLDNFHASIPLEPVRERGFLIYQIAGIPLDQKQGGPVRFYIPDVATCHVEEIDECANVKFVNHIELTLERGFDNRPEDDQAHQELHRKQQ